MGGTIIKINVEKQYVILSSGSLSWSVQKEGTVFYQAVPLSEMRAELEEKYKNEMQKIANENEILTTYAKKLGSQVTELTNENNKLKAELENFIKKTKK
jgi:predicted RNase H-like nuclease (RuvC/YqgF family)